MDMRSIAPIQALVYEIAELLLIERV